MTLRFIETEAERAAMATFIQRQALPFSVEVKAGRQRTTKQNRLQHRWMQDIATQMAGHSPEYWRGYCKLHHGVPIMRAENEEFRAIYDEVIRPLPYEQKLKIMQVPIDLPVTRDMNSKQMSAYLDAIQHHFAEQGVLLTDPEDAMGTTGRQMRQETTEAAVATQVTSEPQTVPTSPSDATRDMLERSLLMELDSDLFDAVTVTEVRVVAEEFRDAINGMSGESATLAKAIIASRMAEVA